MHRQINLLLSLLFALMVVAGCSTQSRTVKSEVVYEPVAATESTADKTVRKTESTETRTETYSEPPGLLSGTVDLVGKTIALPFRVVGGLIDLAF